MATNATTPLTLLRDAYHGTGGFETGSYLVQYPVENATKFLRRQQISYYLNYLRPIVDSHVTPIFRRASMRRDGLQS